MPFAFENSYTKLPDRAFSRVRPTAVAAPSLLAINSELAQLLGLDEKELTSPEGVAVLAGNAVPESAEPVALAYAGHQFGGFVPQLGDGRAILLGELIGGDGKRYDLQLKGSGRTAFSRGGDGRAALGPVLREYVVSEAMAKLGVPTTRALAAVMTGERVLREGPLPGAVLTRVASSHLRVGTFEYFAARQDRELLTELTNYALARHYPHALGAERPGVALLSCVMQAQAKLVARWLALGFVHGVMNTDNTSISGETLDYGPCAFLDAYDPRRTFSSIDRGGRYAFGNQPRIALWNMTRLADTLVLVVDSDRERAAALLTEQLETFPSLFEEAYENELRRKLGLRTPQEGDLALGERLLQEMARNQVDYTVFFRRLCDVAGGSSRDGVAELFSEPAPFTEWLEAWQQRLQAENTSPEERATAMRSANPAFIPRNYRIEEMISAATQGDLQPFQRLCRVLARPYVDQPDAAELATPPGEEQWRYRTFCGT